jgi:hypothetical protein
MNIELIRNKIKESFDTCVDSDTGGRISYSQFSKFAKCPKSWELAYLKNLRTKDPSIHTVFGTSFHETFQDYLKIYFNHIDDSFKYYKFRDRLKEFMIENYQKDVKDIQHFSNPEELNEFWEDGSVIFEELLANISNYFDNKRYDLLGIEVPLYINASELDYDVKMLAYIDIVFYDKIMNTVVLVDIKTSTKGWNKHMRNDKLRQSQLLFYKYYFSKQYDIDYEHINLKFLIVTRKLDYGDSRVSLFSISESKRDVEDSILELTNFVESCFEKDGSYKQNQIYYAVSGDRHKNCKFCEFKDREDLCSKKDRLKQRTT